MSISSGGREIRTLGGYNPTAVFKTAAMGHKTPMLHVCVLA
jgi:hypothetical protein